MAGIIAIVVATAWAAVVVETIIESVRAFAGSIVLLGYTVYEPGTQTEILILCGLAASAGLAVALVGSNGICSGCRVTLTPQRFNEVRQSSQILVCESCGRFLYYQP